MLRWPKSPCSVRVSVPLLARTHGVDLIDPRRLTDLALSERRQIRIDVERAMADISDNLVVKIEERRRKLDRVDQAIAEMRRLQQEIAPLLRPPTERQPTGGRFRVDW
jgi:hypothetical protein